MCQKYRKGGRLNWDKWGNGYKVKDGEKVFSIESTDFFFTNKKDTLNNYQRSFNSDGVRFRVNETHIPHLIFDYIITTHQFYSSSYYKPMSEDREKLHNEIRKLHKRGWGYTKIHTHLRKNGFKIGKSRTTVDKILKKMKKRDEYLSQPILDGIGNFRVEMREI